MLAASNTVGRAGPGILRSGRIALACCICFFATLGFGTARAETRVEVIGASVALDDGVFGLDVDVEVELPGGARRAVEAGLALRFVYEIGIARQRRYLPDPDVASLEQGYELGYHALSQRYILRNLNTGEQQDFGSLSLAIDRMTSLRGLPLIDATLLESGTDYTVRVRTVLSLRSTPDTLSWLLFWTDDWSATSEWYAWTLRP